jgi:hypothetical protein
LGRWAGRGKSFTGKQETASVVDDRYLSKLAVWWLRLGIGIELAIPSRANWNAIAKQ